MDHYNKYGKIKIVDIMSIKAKLKEELKESNQI